jgi:hypothetical protein
LQSGFSILYPLPPRFKPPVHINAGIGQIFWGPGMTQLYDAPGRPPNRDQRTPDILVTPNIGVTCSGRTGSWPSMEVSYFRRRCAEVYRHRDAVQFTNGRVIPLQLLCEGQRVGILSLIPVRERVEAHQAALIDALT